MTDVAWFWEMVGAATARVLHPFGHGKSQVHRPRKLKRAADTQDENVNGISSFHHPVQKSI
jgi:hypothetical protein